MRPQEKAQKLVDKMAMPNNIFQGAELAKQCALIAVDEMLEELDHLAFDDPDYGTYKMQYWQEVKEEIQKL